MEPGIVARRNVKFTFHCITLLLVFNIITWLLLLLLRAGDIQPNPGPRSVASSSGSSFSSNLSTDVFSHLNLSNNLSFVQYNVQSVLNKLDVLQAELFEIDILSFTETWLSPDIATVDLMLRSYNTPERKDRPGDPHGGVMIYVKEGIHYKRRHDLELRGIESIWIELVHNHVYINDIVENIGSHIRLFADDTSLFIIVDDPITSAARLNSDLDKNSNLTESLSKQSSLHLYVPF